MEETNKLKQFNLAEKTAKIQILTAQTAENIIEIGKTLNEVKENLPYGEFEKWLENDVNYSKRTAYNFMKVAKEFPDVQPVAELGIRKLLALTGLETNAREKVIADNELATISTKEVEKIVEEEKMIEKVNRFMFRFSHKILPHKKKPNHEFYKDLSVEEIDILEEGAVKSHEVAEHVRSSMYDSLSKMKKDFNNDRLFAKWLISTEWIEEFEDLLGLKLDKAIEEEKANQETNDIL